MQISTLQGNIAQQEHDCIVINLFQDVTRPAGATGAVDAAMDGTLSRLIADGDFSGEAGTSTLLYTDGKLPSRRVLIVGLGAQESFDSHAARSAAATAANRLAELKGVRTFATVVHGSGIGGLEPAEAAQALAEGTLLACYRPPRYRRDMEDQIPDSCTVVELDADLFPAVSAGIRNGEIVATAVGRARSLISEPGNILHPVELAGRAQSMALESGLSCQILGEADMHDLGMNIFLAVSQGSDQEAQLVVLEHAPSGMEEDDPLVLVGKGVTFDTGGISIKPAAEMWAMKDDMGGAAVVIGAMEAIARLQLPRRVIGVAACVENMPDGAAYRPGDVLTGITGKTTEIISTDAEGRLILADTLGYVARFKPTAVVDLATLTGAVSIALGTQAAGLFANDEDLQAGLLAAADQSGERLWPFPLYDEYMESIKSDIAEVKNSGGRFGGLSTSAKFLEHFTEGYRWAHLDIANMVWAKANVNSFTAKGATGFGVRLLIELAKGFEAR